MTDRALLLDLAMKAGNLLQHPMSTSARAAVRQSLSGVNTTLAMERLSKALDEAEKNEQRPARLPYKD